MSVSVCPMYARVRVDEVQCIGNKHGIAVANDLFHSQYHIHNVISCPALARKHYERPSDYHAPLLIIRG